VLGITAIRPQVDSRDVREALNNAQEALRSYALRVSAHVRKSEPASAELAERLLTPLIQWKDRPSKASEQEETPPPATPSAGEPDEVLGTG
jgi:hypothetical protein